MAHDHVEVPIQKRNWTTGFHQLSSLLHPLHMQCPSCHRQCQYGCIVAELNWMWKVSQLLVLKWWQWRRAMARLFASLKPSHKLSTHSQYPRRGSEIPTTRHPHAFLQAQLHWQHPSTSQRSPHHCLGCTYWIFEAKTLAGASMTPTTILLAWIVPSPLVVPLVTLMSHV